MRETGYYWVQTQWDTWMIAFYDARLHRWETCGCDVHVEDKFWQQIGERLEHVA